MAKDVDALVVAFVGGDDGVAEALMDQGPLVLRRLLSTWWGGDPIKWDTRTGPHDTLDAPDDVPRVDSRELYERYDLLWWRLTRTCPDALAEMFRDDPSPDVPGPVLRALRTVEDTRARPVLLRGLGAASPHSRRDALDGLAVNGTTDDTDAITALLDDDEPYVRRAALKALGRLGDARAVAPVLGHLAGDDYAAAAEALEQIEQRIAGPLRPPVWHDLGDREVVVPDLAELSDPADGACPWRVARVLKGTGQPVLPGECLAVLDYDDMLEADIETPWGGVVKGVRVTTGTEVRPGTVAFVVHARRRVG